MTRRMNYGPRFRSSAVSVGARYDAYLHRGMTLPWVNASPLRRMFNAAKTHSVKNKDKITLPHQKKAAPAISEREQAEERMIERLGKAIEMVEFGLNELAAIPNPTSTFKNRVHQKAIMDLLQHLCSCVSPPLKLARFATAAEDYHQRVRDEPGRRAGVSDLRRSGTDAIQARMVLRGLLPKRSAGACGPDPG